MGRNTLNKAICEWNNVSKINYLTYKLQEEMFDKKKYK